MRLFDSLVLELGVRYDSQSFSSDDQVSPRVNLVYAPVDLGQFRFAWGHYYQSQRPWELQVADGDTTIYPAEKAVYAQLGWEQRFSGGYGLRVDAYQRTIDPVNPRYDNLFTGFTLNPEIERDRVRLEPERSDAYGLEFSLNRRSMSRFDWWINYAYSVIEDRIDGRDVPRSYDQTHAVTAILDWRLGEKWNLNLAWNYHTGWPTTPVSAEVVDIDGEPTIEPIIGPLYSERLDDYHRLDMRLSRRTTWKNGQTFEVYLDIQNLYNRENEAGFSFDERSFTLLPDGGILIDPVAETWLGIFPSFGVTWSF
jgi:outer membrane receptor protein involved in Fe transport